MHKMHAPSATHSRNWATPQPPTALQTDNKVAEGILNNTVKQKRSKAIDMRFYWLQDRIQQGQFNVYWRPGEANLANYISKHHPAKHHRAVRPTYLAPHVPSAV
jgi:hypothetical protein